MLHNLTQLIPIPQQQAAAKLDPNNAETEPKRNERYKNKTYLFDITNKYKINSFRERLNNPSITRSWSWRSSNDVEIGYTATLKHTEKHMNSIKFSGA